jgi:hypothetical protein
VATPLLVGGLIAALASPAQATQPPVQSLPCSLLTAADILLDKAAARLP